MAANMGIRILRPLCRRSLASKKIISSENGEKREKMKVVFGSRSSRNIQQCDFLGTADAGTRRSTRLFQVVFGMILV